MCALKITRTDVTALCNDGCVLTPSIYSCTCNYPTRFMSLALCVIYNSEPIITDVARRLPRRKTQLVSSMNAKDVRWLAVLFERFSIKSARSYSGSDVSTCYVARIHLS